MPFSRTWRILARGKDFQSGYGKVLDFCLQKFSKYPKMDVA